MKKLLLLGLAMVLASAVYAIPVQWGATSGGFFVPTASVDSGVQLAIDLPVTDNYDFTAFKWPFVKVLWGNGKNLEIGASYVDDSYEDSTITSVAAKFVLPYSFQKAGLAIGAQYNAFDYDGSNYNGWLGYLAATLPVFSSSKLTGTVMFSTDTYDDENVTTLAVNLEKQYKNGSAVGVEYLANVPNFINEAGDEFPFWYYAGDYGDHWATVYYNQVVNENLTARIGLFNVGEGAMLNVGASYKF